MTPKPVHLFVVLAEIEEEDADALSRLLGAWDGQGPRRVVRYEELPSDWLGPLSHERLRERLQQIADDVQKAWRASAFRIVE